MHDLNHSDALPESEPPENGSRYTLISGIAGGLLLAILNIALVLANSSAFLQISRTAGTSVPPPAAASNLVGGLQCLTLLIGAVICFVAGFYTGKRAVQRRLGFYAGALVGLLFFLSNAITTLIPGFPTHVAQGGPTSGAGLTVGVMFLIIVAALYCVIAGLIGLLGARIATGKHPYYQKQA